MAYRGKRDKRTKEKEKKENGEKETPTVLGAAIAKRRDGVTVVSVYGGQRARTKDEHEHIAGARGGKGSRGETMEDAFRCATRWIKDGRDFGNAGLYAANNQCILVCSLGLHGRLHRDKCNAANLLTSFTYRVSGKIDRGGAHRPQFVVDIDDAR